MAWDYRAHLPTCSRQEVEEYIDHVRMYEKHQQPYCVGCEYHQQVDIRCLPPLERRPALSRFADVQVCSEHGVWEAWVQLAMTLTKNEATNLRGPRDW